jgi:hypothetical protein
MAGRDEKDCSRKAGVLFLLTLAFGLSEDLTGHEAPRLQLQDASSQSGLEVAVARAIQSASDKLSTQACQEVFSDFRDAAGRTLKSNLSTVGHTGQSYLGLMLFYDGKGMSRCQERSVFASTSPGSRVIYVCSAQFMEKLRRDPALAATLVIHEELHSLGLAENPPDSREITAQVIARCGR